jgi:hypothetical protein
VRHNLFCDLFGNFAVFGFERYEPAFAFLVRERSKPGAFGVLEKLH